MSSHPNRKFSHRLPPRLFIHGRLSSEGQDSASPFTPPSASPGAVSLPPDSDWSSSSDWSSRPTTPAQLPVGAYPQDQRGMWWGMHPFFFGGSPDSRPSSPETPKAKEKIPRPPNAFMLYRSHLLKTKMIPKEVEQRQQNISRVAGECWNMLSKADKELWHAEAKKAMELHRRRHPNYKFTPERKSSRKKAQLDPDMPPSDDKDYIRFLRERCVGIYGPAQTPPRPRKARARRGVAASNPSSSRSPASRPPSLHPSPSSTPALDRVAAAAAAASIPAVLQQVPQPPAIPYGVAPADFMLGMPPPGFLHPEFLMRYNIDPLPNVAADDDVVCFHSTPPFDALSDLLAQTPRAATFGNIAPPAMPQFALPSVMPSSGAEPAREMGVMLEPAQGTSLSAVSIPPQEELRSATPPTNTDWTNFLGCDMQNAASMLDLSAVAHEPSDSYVFDFDVEDPLFQDPSPSN